MTGFQRRSAIVAVLAGATISAGVITAIPWQRNDDHAAAVSTPSSSPDDSLSVILARDAAFVANNPVDAKIVELQKHIRSSGPTPETLERLGWTFVEKARGSGDHGYYLLAGRCARAIRAIDTVSPAADLLEGHTLQSLHHFAEAEQVAARLVATRGAPLDYALYGDVLLDQGRIDEAVQAYERMMRRRPDSRAYSRVAEVRLLTGDLDGAREALHTAARAVSPRDAEAYAWIWSRLALVELQSGHAADALSIVTAAVKTAPDSPVAQLAHGRILLASGDNAGAIAPLERSAAASPQPETMRALADAYAGAGRHADAATTIARLEAGGPSVDPRGFSIWLSESGKDAEHALRLAQAEFEHRRDVYTFAALAIANAVAGHTHEARRHMADALAAGTVDPRLWYHAGLVAEAANQRSEAREWFLKARSAEQMLLPSQRRELAQRLAAQAPLETSRVAGSRMKRPPGRDARHPEQQGQENPR